MCYNVRALWSLWALPIIYVKWHPWTVSVCATGWTEMHNFRLRCKMWCFLVQAMGWRLKTWGSAELPTESHRAEGRSPEQEASGLQAFGSQSYGLNKKNTISCILTKNDCFFHCPTPLLCWIFIIWCCENIQILINRSVMTRPLLRNFHWGGGGFQLSTQLVKPLF